MELQVLKLCLLCFFDMEHRVYRNLRHKDTLFGLELTDLVVIAAVANVVFRVHQPDVWAGKLLNVIIVAISYLILVFIKRRLPTGYISNYVHFLFRNRSYDPVIESQSVYGDHDEL